MKKQEIKFKQMNEINLQKPTILKYALPHRKFKIAVINMLNDVRGTMYEQSENFNKDINKY